MLLIYFYVQFKNNFLKNKKYYFNIFQKIISIPIFVVWTLNWAGGVGMHGPNSNFLVCALFNNSGYLFYDKLTQFMF